MRTNLFVALAFFALPTLGTLSHEAAHALVGAALGADPIVHFDRTSMAPTSELTGRQLAWITAAGPIQTMATGCLGLALLLACRPRQRKRMRRREWTFVWLSLFWMREVALVPANALRRITGRFLVLDEAKMAQALGLPAWSVVLLLGLFGVFAIAAALAAVPDTDRKTILIVGFPASFLGAIWWFALAGPALLP